MKQSKFFSILTLILALTASQAPGRALAEDPLAAAPDYYTLLFENEKVRVLEVKLPAGAVVPTHSHPDHLIYVLTPGTLKQSQADGSSKEITAETGQVLWAPAVTHVSENVGSTELGVVVVELKK